MKATYAPHALSQMARRDISHGAIETVLASPIFTRPSYGYRDEFYGETMNGRTLKVIVARGSDPPHVLTVMPFSRRRLQRLMDREGKS